MEYILSCAKHLSTAYEQLLLDDVAKQSSSFLSLLPPHHRTPESHHALGMEPDKEESYQA